MNSVTKWLARISAAAFGAVLTLVIPVHAWAAGAGVTEAARFRSRRGLGFFPIFGGVCCLMVVGGIVLAVVLISRNRRRRP
jgi:hypothetical protein